MKSLPGFVNQFENRLLKEAIDRMLARLKASGPYEEMLQRWVPGQGTLAPMPVIPLT